MTDLAHPAPLHFTSPADGDQTGRLAAVPLRPRSSGLARHLAPSSTTPTIAGVLLVVAGLALIALAWADVARTTVVGRQLPYLVSAGFTGLALVMIGIVTVNISAKRQDGFQRQRQMTALTEAMTELQRSIDRLEP